MGLTRNRLRGRLLMQRKSQIHDWHAWHLVTVLHHCILASAVATYLQLNIDAARDNTKCQ